MLQCPCTLSHPPRPCVQVYGLSAGPVYAWIVMVHNTGPAMEMYTLAVLLPQAESNKKMGGWQMGAWGRGEPG